MPLQWHLQLDNGTERSGKIGTQQQMQKEAHYSEFCKAYQINRINLEYESE